MGGWRRRDFVDGLRNIGVRAGASTLNGFVTYAIRPSGPTTNNDRLSSLFSASYAPYVLPTTLPLSLANTIGKSDFARPIGERRVRIDADANDGDFAAVVEERGVLITVRLHLDRSALGPRLIEEGEYDGLAAVVREMHRRLEQAVPRRPRQREIGRGRADGRADASGACARAAGASAHAARTTNPAQPDRICIDPRRLTCGPNLVGGAPASQPSGAGIPIDTARSAMIKILCVPMGARRHRP